MSYHFALVSILSIKMLGCKAFGSNLIASSQFASGKSAESNLKHEETAVYTLDPKYDRWYT